MNTTIGKGLTIKGTIHAEEPLTIAGIVNGDVLAADCEVTIEQGALVDGAVTARVITVHGNSKGRLVARDVVRLLQTSSVKADIASPKLALLEGATFSGSVEPARVDAAIRVAAYRGKAEPAVVSVT